MKQKTETEWKYELENEFQHGLKAIITRLLGLQELMKLTLPKTSEVYELLFRIDETHIELMSKGRDFSATSLEILDKALHTKHDPLNLETTKINFLEFMIRKVFEETSADRFMLLCGQNGTEKFRFISAIAEIHKDKAAYISVNATEKYVKLEADEHYHNIVKVAEKQGVYRFFYKRETDALLTKIYKEEKVLYSNIYPVWTYENWISPGSDLKVICSYAKHAKKPFTKKEESIFRLSTQTIKTSIITKENA